MYNPIDVRKFLGAIRHNEKLNGTFKAIARLQFSAATYTSWGRAPHFRHFDLFIPVKYLTNKTHSCPGSHAAKYSHSVKYY